METQTAFTAKLINALYIDAMILADEARSYFEQDNANIRAGLNATQRVEVSCESLRVTTRLMHSIAWLLNQKAYFAGEISQHQLRGNGRALGISPPGDPHIIASLPPEARALVIASEQLYDRLSRLQASMEADLIQANAAVHQSGQAVHQMRERLMAEMAL